MSSVLAVMYPAAFDRDDADALPPTSQVLNSSSKLREEPESEGDTSPDEGVPERHSGWRGHGEPTTVGVSPRQESCMMARPWHRQVDGHLRDDDILSDLFGVQFWTGLIVF